MATTSIALGTSKDATSRLKYSAFRFRPFLRELEAACLAHPHANLVLSGKDPITKFLRRNRKIKKIIPPTSRPSKDQMFNDPRATCAQFIETLESILDDAMTDTSGSEEGPENDQAEQKTEEQLAAESAAATHSSISATTPVNLTEDRTDGENETGPKESSESSGSKTGKDARKEAAKLLTAKLVDDLEIALDNWTNGEGYIYRLAVDSLRHKPSLIVKTVGAGRLQLKRLTDKHNTKTAKTTETMVLIWDSLAIDKSESIEDFRQRWDEFLEDLENAMPEPVIKNSLEKRLKYLQAFEKGGRFLDELKDFRKAKTSIEDMESWFLELENEPSIELLSRHGVNTGGLVNSPALNHASVGNYSGVPNDKGNVFATVAGKRICISFAKFGSCRFGDKCKYFHCEWAKGKRKTIEGESNNYNNQPNKGRPRKPKSEIQCKFDKNGTCRKGSKCPFKHSNPSEIAAYDLRDIPEVMAEDVAGEEATAHNNMFEFEELAADDTPEDDQTEAPALLDVFDFEISGPCPIHPEKVLNFLETISEESSSDKEDGPISIYESVVSECVNDLNGSSSESDSESAPPDLVPVSASSSESFSDTSSESDSEGPPGLVSASTSSSDSHSDSDSESDHSANFPSHVSPTVAEVNMFSRKFFFDEEASEGTEEEVSAHESDSSATEDSDEQLLDTEIAKCKVKTRLDKLKAERMKQKRSRLKRVRKRQAKARESLRREEQRKSSKGKKSKVQSNDTPATTDQSVQVKPETASKLTQTNLTVYQPGSVPDPVEAEAAGLFQPLRHSRPPRQTHYPKNRHSNHVGQIHYNAGAYSEFSYPSRGRRGRRRGRKGRRGRRPRRGRRVNHKSINSKRKHAYVPTPSSFAASTSAAYPPTRRSKHDKQFESRARTFTKLEYKPRNPKCNQSMPVDTVEHNVGVTSVHYKIKRNPLYDGPLKPFQQPDDHVFNPDVASSSFDSEVFFNDENAAAAASTSWGGRGDKIRAPSRPSYSSSAKARVSPVKADKVESWSTVIPPESWSTVDPPEPQCESWSTVVPPSPLDSEPKTTPYLKISNWLKRPESTSEGQWREYMRGCMRLANEPLPPNFKFENPIHTFDVETCEQLRDKAILERRNKGVPALTPTWHPEEQGPTISIPSHNPKWRDELEGCGYNDSDGDVYGSSIAFKRIPLYSREAQDFIKNELGGRHVHNIRPGKDVRELYADYDPSNDPNPKIDYGLDKDAVISTLYYDKYGKDIDKRPLLDSGATHHVTPFEYILVDIKTTKVGQIRGVAGTVKVSVMGTIANLPGEDVEGVLLLKRAARTVLSVGKLIQQHGGHMLLGPRNATHVSPSGKETIIGPRTDEGWYRVERLPSRDECSVNALNTTNQLKREKVQRVHENLGHASPNKMRMILSTQSLKGLIPKDVNLLQKCAGCALGKPRRKPHTNQAKRVPTFYGQHIHSDNTAEQPVSTINGGRVGNVIIDGHTNYVHVAVLRSKKHSVDRLRYVTKNLMQSKTEVIRTDQGGEYNNRNMVNLCSDIGAKHEMSSTQSSQENGKAENCIQNVMNDTRTALASKNIALGFWGYAFHYSAFNINRRPCMANPDCASPYFMLHGRHPDYSRMQPFGQRCTVMYAKGKTPNKIGGKALPGVFLGYADDSGTKAYKVYVKSIRRVVVSPDVTFLDTPSSTNGNPISANGSAPDVSEMKDGPDTPDVSRFKDPRLAEQQQNAGAGQRPSHAHLVRPPNTVPYYSSSFLNRANGRVPVAAERTAINPEPPAARPPSSRQVPRTPNEAAVSAPAASVPNPPATSTTETVENVTILRPEPTANHEPVSDNMPFVRRSTRTRTVQARNMSWSRSNGLQSLVRTEKETSDGPSATPVESSSTASSTPPLRRSARLRNSAQVSAAEGSCGLQLEHSNGTPTVCFAGHGGTDGNQPRKVCRGFQTNKEINYSDAFHVVPPPEPRKSIPTVAHIFMAATNGNMELATNLYTPKTYEQAMRCADSEGWKGAIRTEYNNLVKRGVFKKIKLRDLPPGSNVISGRWVFKNKPKSDGTLKTQRARVVARGFQAKPGQDYHETFAPVAAATTIRIIFAVTVKLGLKLTSADFVGAFQNAKLDTTVYFRPPPGLDCNRDEVWELFMALYGLKNSPILWSESLKKVLLDLDFKQADNDPCLFYKINNKNYILVGIIVDDLIIASRTRQEANALLEAVGKVYEVKNLGKPEYVIGIHINHDEDAGTIHLNQELYISNMAIRFGQQNAKQTTTPAATTTRLTQDMGSPPAKGDYRALIGCLLYVVITRPDVATIISQLSRYLQAPQEAHYRAALRVLRFLLSTKTKSLYYFDHCLVIELELLAYSDSTWNSNPDNSRSRSGYAIFFNGCFIAWKSTLQKLVTLSSCEAEYVALNLAAREVIWLRRLLCELGFEQKPTTILVDNQSAIALTKHKMVKPRTKHIALRYHWIKEQVADGTIIVKYVPTGDNVADFLTKVLSQEKMIHLLKDSMVDGREDESES